MFDSQNQLKVFKLGDPLLHDAQPSIVIPHDHWFAASVAEKDSFSFVGCTVSPGFDFKDFEMAPFDNLVKIFPNSRDIVKKYTRT